jgi:tripartite-type tricarboxylate transporter receptor subunit TctC
MTAAAIVATLAGSPPALCADDKAPVRVLVGLAAGGSNDLIARELAERLRTITGDQYIVENKPGAAQRLALAELKRAAPDGRTFIVATNSPFSTLPNVYGDKLGYDPVKDFTPIGRMVKFETRWRPVRWSRRKALRTSSLGPRRTRRSPPTARPAPAPARISSG